MKKIFYLLGSLLLVLMVFSACKKSPIQKANDDYDYNSTKPIILSLTGPTTTAASGLAAVTYTAPSRGGSTFKWEVIGHAATIVLGNPSNTVEITFDQSDINVPAVIKVVETTQGGISSPPFELAVSLTKFIPRIWDDFPGNWTGVETDGSGVDHDVDVDLTDAGDNTLMFPVIAGTPTLMGPIFEGWGELFQAGFGNDGNVYMTVNLLSGALTIECQYWGQTMPGPYDYWISGEGTWEGVGTNEVKMTFEYGMHWDDACDTDYNHSKMVISHTF